MFDLQMLNVLFKWVPFEICVFSSQSAEIVVYIYFSRMPSRWFETYGKQDGI